MTGPAIEPLSAIGAAVPTERLAPAIAAPPAGSFSQMLLDGVAQVDRSLAQADAAVQAFALDDAVPLHQVTFALERARISFELMLQVRSRLVEGYQELMRMQI